MRPITLKLSGLHSYRDLQVIDFEELCAAGLFGIFGPTGSGKSTILDAITLALYGQVVRTGGGTHPQQALNQLESRVFVSFTFELGSAAERQRFTVEREYGLDKKGNKRPPEVRLIRCSLDPGAPDEVLESKASTATSAIEQLIGLTMHDFSRAVILPQGQFAKFLTLKGSERNEMLQRIFHLQEYGEQLNERIRDAFELNKQQLHRLDIQLATVGDAGPEALEQAQQEFQLAALRQQQMEQEFSAFTKHKQELQQVREWLDEQERIARQTDHLLQQAEDIEQLRQLVKEIEASRELWPLARKMQMLEQEVQKRQALQTSQRRELQASTLQENAAQQQYLSLQQRLRADEPRLIEQRGKLAEASLWEQELSRLEQTIQQVSCEHQQIAADLAEAERAAEAGGQQLAALDGELKRLDEQLQLLHVSPEERGRLHALLDAKNAWDQALAAFQEVDEDVKAATLALEQLAQVKQQQHESLQSASRRREAAAAEQQRLEEQQVPEHEIELIREQLTGIKEIGSRWREWTNKQIEWQPKWEACERSLTDKQQQVLTLAQQLRRDEECLALLEQKKLAAEQEYSRQQQVDMARTLRRSLQEGEPCPVCGSVEHSALHPVDQLSADQSEQTELQLLEEVRRCEQEAAEARKLVRSGQDALQAAKVDLAGVQTRRAALQDEQSRLEQGLDEIRAELQTLGSHVQSASVDDLLEHYRQAQQLLQDRIAARDHWRMQLEQARLSTVALREQELKQKAAYDQSAAVLDQLEQKLAQAGQRLADRSAKLAQAQSALAELQGTPQMETIESRWKQLEEQESKSEQLRIRRSQLEESKKQTQQSVQQLQEHRTNLSIQEVTRRQRLTECQAEHAQKRERWLQITQGAAAEGLILALDEQLDRLRQEVDAALQAREAAGRLRQQLQDQVTQTEAVHTQVVRQQLEAAAAFDSAARTAGLQDVARIASLYEQLADLPAFEQKINSYANKLTQNQNELEKLANQLAGRTVEPDEWQTVQHAWQELEQLLRQTQDQAAVARDAAAKVTEGHERWKVLQAEHAALTDEQSRLDELRKLFEGKAFVQFIAEEKLAAIARDASYHLARMTKNRYALEVGADGEFVLRDEGLGGMRRPVTTLSGGETFLTALSLALALSVEIQMRGGKLEFFFLDEGFGTLDPELLEVVLDALERLRMDEFAIGLISHVPELRMRMPRRLVVTPAEAMGAGSQIAMEIE